MKSDAYWASRLEALNESQLNKGEKYIDSMNTQYGKAMSSIQRDIDVFYGRFAINNGVDMATARQMLKAGELKEFKWSVEEYIKRGKENAIDQRWMKELENASIRVRMSRLEALQIQMQQHIEVLAGARQVGAQSLLAGIYKDNYHRSIFELQKGVGIGTSFAKLDNTQLDKLLSTPWAPDGSNFSGRIWADRTKLISELKTALTQNLIRGDSKDQVISEFSKRMGVSRSAAARIIMTESAYISGQSRLDAYNELGVTEYKYTATLDRRTSSVCRSMDGEIIPIAEAKAGVNYPPLHAHCRSTTIPHYEDNVKERAARDDDEKTYAVPGDMTYQEWEKEHVNHLDISKQNDSQEPNRQSAVPFIPAQSIKDAETAAIKTLGFSKADYTGLDLESANTLNSAMDKVMRKYPSIKGFAKEIEAVNDSNFIAQAELAFIAGEAVSNLKISSHYYNSIDIDDIIKKSVAAKHFPDGSTKESIFMHEFGHLLEYAHAMKLLGTWTGAALTADDAQIIWSRIKKGALSTEIKLEALSNLGLLNTAAVIKSELSNYANTNSKEFLAEAFAEAEGSATPRQLAREAIKILQRKLKEAGM